MTLKEAVRAVYVMTYDDCRQVRHRGSLVTDPMLRRVAGWRIHEPEAWREIRDRVCAPTDTEHSRRPGLVYAQYGKPKATIIAVRERALRESA